MNAPAILLQDVVVTAGGRTVLDNISLQIAAGERVAVIGHNGAGKSTLLKLITGAVQPQVGSVTVLGHDLSARLPKRKMRHLRARIAQVFQGLHLVQRLSVMENVLLGSLARNDSWLTWARIFPSADIRQAETALRQVGLIGKAHLRTDRLSGGERQKTAIARMLMQQAQLVLADEPTAALDPVSSLDIARMLARLSNEQAATLVSVVHDPGLLPVLAERVIGMRAGRIVFDLPSVEVNDDVLSALYREAASGWVARLEQPSASMKEPLSS